MILTCLDILGELVEKQFQRPSYQRGQRTSWNITHAQGSKSHRTQYEFKDNGTVPLAKVITVTAQVYITQLD